MLLKKEQKIGPNRKDDGIERPTPADIKGRHSWKEAPPCITPPAKTQRKLPMTGEPNKPVIQAQPPFGFHGSYLPKKNRVRGFKPSKPSDSPTDGPGLHYKQITRDQETRLINVFNNSPRIPTVQTPDLYDNQPSTTPSPRNNQTTPSPLPPATPKSPSFANIGNLSDRELIRLLEEAEPEDLKKSEDALEEENKILRKYCEEIAFSTAEAQKEVEALKNKIAMYRRVEEEDEEIYRRTHRVGRHNKIIKKIMSLGLNLPHLEDLCNTWAGYTMGRVAYMIELNGVNFLNLFDQYAVKGYVSEESFKRLMYEFEPKLKFEQLNRLWMFADSDGSGGLNCLEFMRLLCLCSNGEMTEEYYDVVLSKIYAHLQARGGFTKVYSMIDRNYDGNLTRKEMFRLLHHLDLKLTEKEMNEIYDRIDKSGDGGITIAEFEEALGFTVSNVGSTHVWAFKILSQLAHQLAEERGQKGLSYWQIPKMEFKKMIAERFPLLKKVQLQKLWEYFSERHDRKFDGSFFQDDDVVDIREAVANEEEREVRESSIRPLKEMMREEDERSGSVFEDDHKVFVKTDYKPKSQTIFGRDVDNCRATGMAVNVRKSFNVDDFLNVKEVKAKKQNFQVFSSPGRSRNIGRSRRGRPLRSFEKEKEN